MTRPALAAVLLLIVILVALGIVFPPHAASDQPAAATAVPLSAFEPVRSSGNPVASGYVHAGPAAPPASNPTPAPSAPTPAPSLRAVPRLAAVRAAAPQASVASVTGIASWYHYVPGEAAAGPALRAALGAGWRGRSVKVNGIPVTLSDFMRADRLIDLDAATFARLAPLSQGLTEVTVAWPIE